MRVFRQRWALVTLRTILLIHAAAIFCWCIPLNTPLLDKIRGGIAPYMLWSGLFQAWDTFAPAPKMVNAYIEGVVIARDGQLYRYSFPRMEQLGLAERYYKERYRKFAEVLSLDNNSAVWADVARRLAHQYKNDSNPPEVVMLIRYSTDIGLPESGMRASGRPQAKVFFQSRISPEDLQ